MRDIQSVLIDSGHSGYIANMNGREYRKIPRMNPSSIAAGLVGCREIDPRAVRDAFQGTEQKRSADSQARMDRGTLAHMALLQPDSLASSIAVWNGGRRYGAEYDVWCDQNHGKLQLTEQDYTKTMGVVRQISQQKLVASLLCDIEPEVAMFTAEDDIFCMGMVDAVNFAKHTIVDIKTTESGIDYKSVENTIRQFRYREKMSLYRRWLARLTGTNKEEWACFNLFIGIGNTIGLRSCEFMTDSLEFGEMRMDQCLTEVRKCLHSKTWPMFQVEDVVSVASWELQEAEPNIEY